MDSLGLCSHAVLSRSRRATWGCPESKSSTKKYEDWICSWRNCLGKYEGNSLKKPEMCLGDTNPKAPWDVALVPRGDCDVEMQTFMRIRCHYACLLHDPRACMVACYPLSDDNVFARSVG